MHLNVNAFSVIWTISCICGHAHTSIQPSTVVMIVSLDPRAACQSIGRLPVVLSRAGYNLCWVHRWQTEGTMGSLHLSSSFICETGSTGCFTFVSGCEKCKVRRQFTDKWQSIPLSYCFFMWKSEWKLHGFKWPTSSGAMYPPICISNSKWQVNHFAHPTLLFVYCLHHCMLLLLCFHRDCPEFDRCWTKWCGIFHMLSNRLIGLFCFVGLKIPRRVSVSKEELSHSSVEHIAEKRAAPDIFF